MYMFIGTKLRKESLYGATLVQMCTILRMETCLTLLDIVYVCPSQVLH